MCARRFLIVIFVLTLLTVAGAFAFFQFGSSVLLCGLFYLLGQHAARRAYFSVWARAWPATDFCAGR